MKKNPILHKVLRREIKENWGRFLSIFLIVMLGVAFLSGIRASEPDMRRTANAYYQEAKLADAQVVSTMGFTSNEVERLAALPGIKEAIGTYSVDAYCEVERGHKVLRVMAVEPKMNHFRAEKGRLPQNKKECLVDMDFFKKYHLKLGQTITLTLNDEQKKVLKEREFTVVGAGSQVKYISFGRGETTMGTGEVAGFLGVVKEDFHQDTFTDVYLLQKHHFLAHTKEEEKSLKKLKKTISKVEKDTVTAQLDNVKEKARKTLAEKEKDLAQEEKTAMASLQEGKNTLAQKKKELLSGKRQLKEGEEKIHKGELELNAKEAELTSGRAKVASGMAQIKSQEEQLKAQENAYRQGEIPQVVPQEGMVENPEEKMAAAKEALAKEEAGLRIKEQEIQAGLDMITAQRKKLEAEKGRLAKEKQKVIDGETKLHQGEADLQKKEEEALAKIQEGKETLAQKKKEVENLSLPKWYINTRLDFPDYEGYSANANRMGAIGKVFPGLFFLVAALISLTSMTRMVEEQRGGIGTMKALGYGKKDIALIYVCYGFLASFLGGVAGVLWGQKFFPYIILSSYQIMYQHFPKLLLVYQWNLGGLAILVAMLCTLGATFGACYKELLATPASLMRPVSPATGKRTLLEHIPFLWKRLNFTWKATCRNLIRYKKRFFMTLAGIGGCMALMLVGFGLRDSITLVANRQYKEIQTYDGAFFLPEAISKQELNDIHQKLKQEDVLYKADVFLKKKKVYGLEESDAYICATNNARELEKMIRFSGRGKKKDKALPEEGVILTEKLARLLDVKKGDTISLDGNQNKKVTVKVADISENYMGHFIYGTKDTFAKAGLDLPDDNTIYFQLPKGKMAEDFGETILKKTPVLGVMYTSTLESRLDDMLSTLHVVIVVLIASAGALAFIVLYNLNTINISERRRELATIKLLGFYDQELASYVYRENIILTLLGSLLGGILGTYLHRYVITTVEVEDVMFGKSIAPSSYLYSFLLTLLFSVIVNLAMYFKLKKINMVDVLKSVE